MDQIETLGVQTASIKTSTELTSNFNTLKKLLLKQGLLSIQAQQLNASNPEYTSTLSKLQIIQHTYEVLSLKAVELEDFVLFEKVYTFLQPFYVDILTISRDTVTKTVSGAENVNRFKILTIVLLLHLTHRSTATASSSSLSNSQTTAKIAQPLTTLQRFHAVLQHLTLAERSNEFVHTVTTINDSLSQGSFISFSSDPSVAALNQAIPGSKRLTDQLWQIVLTAIAKNIQAAHQDGISEALLMKVYQITPSDRDFIVQTCGWTQNGGQLCFPSRKSGASSMDDDATAASDKNDKSNETQVATARNLFLVKEIIDIAKQSEKIV